MLDSVHPRLDQKARGPSLPSSPVHCHSFTFFFFKPCNIAALLQAMQDHFSRAPPLYAKPKSSSPAPQPPSSPSSSSTLSHPQRSSASQPLPLPQSPNQDPPALPPKPVSSHQPVVPPRPAPTPATLPLAYPHVCPYCSKTLDLSQSSLPSRLTWLIGRHRLCPRNLVQMRVRPNITSRSFLPWARMLVTEISFDQPQNSPEIPPLPPLLITAHQCLR